MKKLLITVNGKRYDVDVEVVEDDEGMDYVPTPRKSPKIVDSYVTPPLAGFHPKTPVRVGDSKKLTSPINGVILEIPVTVGQGVKQNEVLFVVEAMKMKTNISSPQEGTVKTIDVKVAETIEAGQVLLTFA